VAVRPSRPGIVADFRGGRMARATYGVIPMHMNADLRESLYLWTEV